MPLAALIPAAIGGVTSIIGGIQGASAAKNAAAAQQAAALAAGKTVTDAATSVNPSIGAAATTAGTGVTTAANTGALNVIGAGRDAGTAVTGPGGAIANANAGLNPFISTGQNAAGTLNTALAPGGDLTKTFDASQMEANDPGYAMRIKQGSLALQRAQAATGSGGGGGAAKALVDYGQQAGSAEYGNAFTRFQQAQQQKFGMLATTEQMGINPAMAAGQNDMQGTEFAGNQDVATNEFAAGQNTNAAEFAGTAGMTATQTEAANTMAAAKYSGDAQMGAGNAKAAGDVGSANAWNGMLSGIGQAANTYATLSQMGQQQENFGPIQPYSGPSSWTPAGAPAPSVAFNPGNYNLPSVFGAPPTAPAWNQ